MLKDRPFQRSELVARFEAEFLGELGAPYKSISPHGKGRKLTAPEFARLTGWKARTNNHGRDAAMLVFGMKG